MLNLDTYQGMSDDEIDMVLEQKVRERVMSANNLATIQLRTQALNEMIAMEQANHEQLSNMVQSALSKRVRLERVEGNNG